MALTLEEEVLQALVRTRRPTLARTTPPPAGQALRIAQNVLT